MAALAVSLAGCVHAEPSRARVRAQLVSLQVVDGASTPPGELRLQAHYQLRGLALGAWAGDAAALTVSLDDEPFAAVVSRPQVAPGDALTVPIALGFSRAPLAASGAWGDGRPVRVRLRGHVTLRDGSRQVRFPTDAEAQVVLPASALPHARD